MEVTELLSNYVRQGFCKVQPLVTEDELRTLQVESARLLAEPARPREEMLRFFADDVWKSCTWTDPMNCTIHYDFLGDSPAIDAILDRILGHPPVAEFLTAALGTGYRIWYFQIRRANAGAAGRRMHVDEPGETTLSILLDDQMEKAGTTVMVPGSQFWPRVINSFPFVQPGHMASRTVGATGRAGEMYFFSNTTWHGREPNGPTPAATILISFVPHGSKQETRRPPRDVLDRLGPSLRKLLEPQPGLVPAPPRTADLADIAFCRPHIGALSPWLPVIAAARTADRSLHAWRKFKAWRREGRTTNTPAHARPAAAA